MREPETIIGRRDWEVVKFDDYQHDMDELGNHSRGVIEGLCKEIEQLRWALWQAAKQSGGELKLHEDSYMMRRGVTLETSYSPSDRTMRVRSVGPPEH